MRDVPGTEYIKKTKQDKYIINKKINGTTYCFGIYKTLDNAIHYRNYFQCKGWENCLDERLIYSETYEENDPLMRYVYFMKSTGNYQIHKKINGVDVNFGTYTSLDEALFWRDYFEENNWNTNERLFYSKSSYISRLPSGKYNVVKQFNGTKISYGTFDTIEEAEYQVKLCKRFGWDIRLKPFDCMKHIIKMDDGRKAIYRIGREEDNKTVYYGSFNNLLDAQFERDLLVLCDWDYEALDSIDESCDGDFWLTNKKASTLFKKNPKGVNDYFWFKNSREQNFIKLLND